MKSNTMRRGVIFLLAAPLLLTAASCSGDTIESPPEEAIISQPVEDAVAASAQDTTPDADSIVAVDLPIEAEEAEPQSREASALASSSTEAAVAGPPTTAPAAAATSETTPPASNGEARVAAAAPGSIYSGVYTTGQARRGNEIQQRECGACHTPTDWAQGRLLQAYTGSSAYDLVAQLQATMPMDGPGRLSWQEYTDIVAYILELNTVPTGSGELPTDEDHLRSIRLEYRR